jgi:hypothetical protein
MPASLFASVSLCIRLLHHEGFLCAPERLFRTESLVWLPNRLAGPVGMWIIAPEVVQKFGDLKKPESAIGTAPFLTGPDEYWLKR